MSIVRAVHVTINGESRQLAAPTTVEDMIRMLGLDWHRVAVELNREIVPRGSYAARSLEDGDVLEIVHLVGGG